MLFYRVKPKYDGVIIRKNGMALIANELFDADEYATLLEPDPFGMRINPYFVERVRIRKKKTYTQWGARFEMKGD